MGARLECVVFDAADPAALAGWWAAALGWTAEPEGMPGWWNAGPAPGEPGPYLLFGPVADPKQGRNRLHLDLRSGSSAGHAALVERLTGLGARPVDIGQGAVPWVVLADPEGNELCVLDPRDAYEGTGPIAAVVVDAADPARLAGFWGAATGWPVARSGDGFAALRDPAGGPFLELVASDSVKRGKNRLHIDLRPVEGATRDGEADRLITLGAEPADIGQGTTPWVVLADPEGNELCVLPERTESP
jgi:hypothetical protein